MLWHSRYWNHAKRCLPTKYNHMFNGFYANRCDIDKLSKRLVDICLCMQCRCQSWHLIRISIHGPAMVLTGLNNCTRSMLQALKASTRTNRMEAPAAPEKSTTNAVRKIRSRSMSLPWVQQRVLIRLENRLLFAHVCTRILKLEKISHCSTCSQISSQHTTQHRNAYEVQWK